MKLLPVYLAEHLPNFTIDPPTTAIVPFTFSEYEQASQYLMPSPPLGGAFSTQEELLNTINNFTKLHGYACSISGSSGRKNAKTRLYIRCTRGSNPRPSKSKNTRPGAGSQRIGCPFMAIATRNLDHETPVWHLTEVRNPEHNHAGSSEGAHPRLRRMEMTAAVREDIRQQYRVHAKPAQILSFIRSKYNMDVNNPVIGSQDVKNYNSVL